MNFARGSLDNNNINILGNNERDIEVQKGIIDLEAKLTLPELNFLEAYLGTKLTVPQAFKAVNFPNIEHLGDKALYKLGAKS